MTALFERFAVSFAVTQGYDSHARSEEAATIRMVTRDLSGGPPGIRTLNQWIKSPLLCR